jgi:hypothetical protein
MISLGCLWNRTEDAVVKIGDNIQVALTCQTSHLLLLSSVILPFNMRELGSYWKVLNTVVTLFDLCFNRTILADESKARGWEACNNLIVAWKEDIRNECGKKWSDLGYIPKVYSLLNLLIAWLWSVRRGDEAKMTISEKVGIASTKIWKTAKWEDRSSV